MSASRHPLHDPSPQVLEKLKDLVDQCPTLSIENVQWAGTGDREKLRLPYALVTIAGSAQRELTDQWDIGVTILLNLELKKPVSERLKSRDLASQFGQETLFNISQSYEAARTTPDKPWIPGVHVFSIGGATNQPLEGESDESLLIQEITFLVSARLLKRPNFANPE